MKPDNPKTYYSLCEVYKKLNQIEKCIKLLKDGTITFIVSKNIEALQEFRKRMVEY